MNLCWCIFLWTHRQIREIVDISASSVDIHKFCLVFIGFGLQWEKITFHPEIVKKLSKKLCNTENTIKFKRFSSFCLSNSETFSSMLFSIFICSLNLSSLSPGCDWNYWEKETIWKKLFNCITKSKNHGNEFQTCEMAWLLILWWSIIRSLELK